MVRSTFAGFSVAQLAMAASQTALNVVGQNVSNINTTGYTRQRLDQQSVSPTGHSVMSSQFNIKVGQGVMATGVSQIRDPFLDIQYRGQLAEVGTVDAMDSVLERLGDIFDETASSKIGTALNEVISQLENMARPDTGNQGTYDTLVRSAMETFINLIHDNAKELTSLREEYVNKLTGTDGLEIDSILSKIVELNKSIKNSQVLGNPALELQDQRNELIDSLATYLPIDVTYEEKTMGANIKIETLKVTFTDADGNQHTLIDDQDKGTVRIEETADMGVGIFITSAGGAPANVDVTDILGDGVIKGYADMLNQRGVFDGSDTKGIGFYEDYFDTFINAFATEMNNLNQQAGGTLFTTSDGSTTFTAENIRISDEWMNGTVKLVASTDPDAGAGAYENIQRMINLLSKDDYDFQGGGGTVFTGTFLEGYDFLQNTQSVERSSVSTILTNRTTMLNQIANSKDSVSAVSLDEEVMNLMRYSQSYNAAARLMTTLDEALNTLINNTGVVGR